MESLPGSSSGRPGRNFPEEFRTAVVLCDVAGLSYREIGEFVGVPVGTVQVTGSSRSCPTPGGAVMTPEWLSAHLDGELTPAEAAEVEAALAADPELRAEYEGLAGVREILRGEASVEPAAGALERIMRRVWRQLRWWLRWCRSSAGAAPPGLAAAVGAVDGDHRERRRWGRRGPRRCPRSVTSWPATRLRRRKSPEFMAAGRRDGDGVDRRASVRPCRSDYAMEHAFVDDATIHLLYRTAAEAAWSRCSVRRANRTWTVFPTGRCRAWGHTTCGRRPMEPAMSPSVDGNGFVWTVVAEEPHDTMMVAMMDDLPVSGSNRWGIGSATRSTPSIEPFRFWE